MLSYLVLLNWLMRLESLSLHTRRNKETWIHLWEVLLKHVFLRDVVIVRIWTRHIWIKRERSAIIRLEILVSPMRITHIRRWHELTRVLRIVKVWIGNMIEHIEVSILNIIVIYVKLSLRMIVIIFARIFFLEIFMFPNKIFMLCVFFFFRLCMFLYNYIQKSDITYP